MTLQTPPPRYPKTLIRLRYATTDDVGTLIDLYTQFFAEVFPEHFDLFDASRAEEELRKKIANLERPHVVAIAENEIVGFVAWESDVSFTSRPIMVMRELYVLPKWRRNTIGRNLVGAILDACQKLDAWLLQAAIIRDMPTLRNLFDKFGFEISGYTISKRFGP